MCEGNGGCPGKVSVRSLLSEKQDNVQAELPTSKARTSFSASPQYRSPSVPATRELLMPFQRPQTARDEAAGDGSPDTSAAQAERTGKK